MSKSQNLKWMHCPCIFSLIFSVFDTKKLCSSRTCVFHIKKGILPVFVEFTVCKFIGTSMDIAPAKWEES